MANRRMLHRNISLCEQLAGCSLLAKLLYTWGLPHTSDWGVLHGSPTRLKGQVLPLEVCGVDDVLSAASELLDAGLWVAFVHEGDPYVYYPTFSEYQDLSKRTNNPRDGMPKPPTSDETPRLHPTSPDFGEIHPTSPLIEQNRTEGKGREGNHAQARETAHLEASNSPALVAAFRHWFCDPNPAAKSVPQAQEYALQVARQLAVPSAGITEAQVLGALESGNGPRAGKEQGGVFGAEAYLQRLLSEQARASPGRLTTDPAADRDRFARSQAQRMERLAAGGGGGGGD